MTDRTTIVETPPPEVAPTSLRLLGDLNRYVRGSVEWNATWKIAEARWTPIVARLTRRHYAKWDEADDVLHSFLMALLAELPSLPSRTVNGSLRPWLYGVVRETLNHLRRANRATPLTESMLASEETVRFLDEEAQRSDDRTTARRDHFKQLRAEFRRAEATLRRESKRSETTWRCFYLIERKGMKGEEVEAALGLGIGAAFQYRNRVRESLLNEMGLDPGDERNKELLREILRDEVRAEYRLAETTLRREARLAATAWECFDLIERVGLKQAEVERRLRLDAGDAARNRDRVAESLLTEMGLDPADRTDWNLLRRIARDDVGPLDDGYDPGLSLGPTG